jgi:membrane protease YdiL (CAAX protease family)
MPEQQVDPWLGGGIAFLFLASLSTWFYLLARRSRRGCILAYEPREPVPWGGWAALLAIVFTTLVIANTALTRILPNQAVDAPNDHAIENLVSGITFQTAVTICFFLVVVAVSSARPRDLGLSWQPADTVRDIAVGIVACLASFVPVWSVQALIISIRGAPDQVSEHPLIKLVMREPSPVIMLLAFVAAVIVAPLCEEIAYRLLLQGWLEKWEDERIGWRWAVTPTQQFAISPTPGETVETSAADVADDPIVPESPSVYDPTLTLTPVSDNADEVEPPPPTTPPRRGLSGLPYGSVPILISSTLFSLAHLGHGADPLPLFPLALILGYTYHRTHSVLPCIVTHMLFNFASMVGLWRMISVQMK